FELATAGQSVSAWRQDDGWQVRPAVARIGLYGLGVTAGGPGHIFPGHFPCVLPPMLAGPATEGRLRPPWWSWSATCPRSAARAMSATPHRVALQLAAL